MRKTTIIFLFGSLLCYSAISQNNTKDQTPTPGPILTEVNIGIPNLKASEFNDLKLVLSEIKGVRWVGYCEDQKYIFLGVNRSLQPDDKFITDRILSVNNSLQLYFKTAPMYKLLNACGDKQKAVTR